MFMEFNVFYYDCVPGEFVEALDRASEASCRHPTLVASTHELLWYFITRGEIFTLKLWGHPIS